MGLAATLLAIRLVAPWSDGLVFAPALHRGDAPGQFHPVVGWIATSYGQQARWPPDERYVPDHRQDFSVFVALLDTGLPLVGAPGFAIGTFEGQLGGRASWGLFRTPGGDVRFRAHNRGGLGRSLLWPGAWAGSGYHTYAVTVQDAVIQLWVDAKVQPAARRRSDGSLLWIGDSDEVSSWGRDGQAHPLTLGSAPVQPFGLPTDWGGCYVAAYVWMGRVLTPEEIGQLQETPLAPFGRRGRGHSRRESSGAITPPCGQDPS